MKRYLTCLLPFVALLALGAAPGCGDDDDDDNVAGKAGTSGTAGKAGTGGGGSGGSSGAGSGGTGGVGGAGAGGAGAGGAGAGGAGAGGAGAGGAGAGGAPGTAYNVLALGEGNKLYSFKANDTANVKTITVAGIKANTALEGVDVRSSDGKLYGLASDGTLYNITIDLTGTGTATAANGQDIAALTLGQGGIALDFNPASKLGGNDMGNALRLIDGAISYRLNPVAATIVATDTALAFKAGDTNAGDVPDVVAAAYTNAFAGTMNTVLFDIETGNDVLVKQGDPDPNLGVLTTVGSLGIAVGDFAGFDIVTTTNGTSAATNEGFLVSEGNFYSVNIGTGTATLVGAIAGATGLRGVSVSLPTP